MQGQLKVTPEELRSTSTDFEGRGQKVSNLTQEMLSLVQGLSSAWEGEASSAYLKKFSELQQDITQINNKIKEHVTDLLQMAEQYEKAENANEEAAAALSSNLID